MWNCENVGIMSQFPQTEPLFLYGTINGVRIGDNDGFDLSIRWRGGLPVRLVVQLSSQYVRENSELKLNLKMST